MYIKYFNIYKTFGLKQKGGKFAFLPQLKQWVSSLKFYEILSRICCHNSVVLGEALLSYDLRKGFIAKA